MAGQCGSPFEEAGRCCWLTVNKKRAMYILFGVGIFLIFSALFIGVL
jgi:hypothetical protein